MASVLKKGATYLRAPTNAVSFALRRRFSRSRGRVELVNEDKAGLFSYLQGFERSACEQRHLWLDVEYDLAELRAHSTRLDYRDNLYLLDALEQISGSPNWPKWPEGEVRVVDVGSKNFSYASGLERFFSRAKGEGEPRPLVLTGIELDGYGIYRDLCSRADHASAYVSQASQAAPTSVVEYRVGDFLEEELPRANFITLLFPFVTRYALLQWGLPMRYFQPEAILAHTLAMLEPGGAVIVLNQTEKERHILHGMVTELGATVDVSQALRSKLVDYWEQTQDRQISIIQPGDSQT